MGFFLAASAGRAGRLATEKKKTTHPPPAPRPFIQVPNEQDAELDHSFINLAVAGSNEPVDEEVKGGGGGKGG